MATIKPEDLKEWKEKQRRAKLALIAEGKYCANTDDIEIDVDQPPEISESEDGFWCQAWVWVSWDEVEENDEPGTT